MNACLLFSIPVLLLLSLIIFTLFAINYSQMKMDCQTNLQMQLKSKQFQIWLNWNLQIFTTQEWIIISHHVDWTTTTREANSECYLFSIRLISLLKYVVPKKGFRFSFHSIFYVTLFITTDCCLAVEKKTWKCWKFS